MKAIGYVRVSSDKQVDGYGLDVQTDAIRAWAKEHGHRIVRIVADEGVSGATPDRDGLAEVLGLLQAKKATTVVVVYRLDRLARDLILQEQLIAECRRHGAELASCSPTEAAFIGDDDADPSRKMVRQIIGAVSEWEKSMVRLRLQSGRKRKAQSGGYAGYGAPAYGQRSEAGELVANEDETALVARITALHTEGVSLRGIATTLTEEGFLPRRGKAWHPMVLSRIVARIGQEAA